MNTDRLLKLASPYLIILILDAAVGYLIWFGQPIFMDITDFNELDRIPSILITNVGLIFQLIVMVLLFLDLRKHNIRYYLIPAVGFFFPVLGITMFLLIMMTRDETSTAD